MNTHHHSVDRKAPGRSAQHIHEEHNKKGPSEAASVRITGTKAKCPRPTSIRGTVNITTTTTTTRTMPTWSRISGDVFWFRWF